MSNLVLVTGGAGFIGSHLIRALIQRGDEVRILDNFSTGSRRNLIGLEKHIEIVEGDLRDPATCALACRDVEVVYHLGALGSVPRSVEDPLTTNAVNVQGTLNLLNAARSAGVRRLVFSSSSSVYGDTPTLPKHEGMRLSPRSPYAVSKLAGEEYCRAFTLTYGLETVGLRYFNVFGPRQDPNSQYAAVIPRFISALLTGRQPVIHGDGQQSRDFTFVANVVDANLLAAQAPGAAGEIFNVACGSQITIAQVLKSIGELLECQYVPAYVDSRPGDIKSSWADIRSASIQLQYRPQISFAEGLARTVEWYLTESRNEVEKARRSA